MVLVIVALLLFLLVSAVAPRLILFAVVVFVFITVIGCEAHGTRPIPHTPWCPSDQVLVLDNDKDIYTCTYRGQN